MSSRFLSKVHFEVILKLHAYIAVAFPDRGNRRARIVEKYTFDVYITVQSTEERGLNIS